MDEALWLVKSFAVLRMTKAKVLAIGKYIIAANWNTPGEWGVVQ
jgi:hypothetical protein